MNALAHRLQQLIALGECPCKSRAWSNWDETIGEAVEIIKRLPVTADGVVVIPMTDTVWHPEWEQPLMVWGNGNAAPCSNTQLGTWRVDTCYSTHKASKEAQKEDES
jgi:hypothetical protein